MQIMYIHNKTAIMTEGAMCIALSFVLSRIVLFRMPQGGSISFELVPLLLFTYRRGFKWGIGAGALVGVIKILFGGYFLNVLQVLLDYPVAFACVGFAAISPKILGLIVAAVLHISCSVISGVIFFANFAPEGQSPFIYSLAYNVPVLSVKYIVCGIIAFFLWKYIERLIPEK